MGTSRNRTGTVLVVLVLVGSVVAGCDLTIGSSGPQAGTSDGEAVELVIGNELTKMGGVAPASISCPAELVHEEGRRYECTVVHPRDGEQVIDVTMRAPTGFSWHVRG